MVKIPKTLIISTLTGLIFGQFLFPLLAFAQAPRFNIFTPYTHNQEYNRDYYLLDIKNDTQAGSWNDPISANPGDVLTFSVYYHNGVNGTTAHNTKIRVSIPSTTGTQIISTAYLWADNAENATAANPFTETGTVNISSPQGLEYIPGSTRWFPNQADWRSASPTPFPFGQSGDEIVGPGVNIGDIIGCWEFSGQVIFKVRVSSANPVSPNLAINKTAKNITKGEINWFESTNVDPGDRIAFSIRIDSIGGVAATNVIVSDTLPSGLSYISGSTKVDNNYVSDGIIDNGINIGNILNGQFKTVTFEASVASEPSFSSGVTYLTNYGYAKADNIPAKSDTAQVIVYRGFPPSPPPPSPQTNLNLRKIVQNLSRPNGTDTDNNALPGEILKYTFIYQNLGNTTINNLRIIDYLPSYVSFISLSSGGDYDKEDNKITWQIGSAIADSSRSGSVSYQVKVLTPPQPIIIVNSGVAKANGIADLVSNETKTTVNLPTVSAGSVKAVTGGNPILPSLVGSTTVTLLSLLIIWLVLRYFDFLTKLRLVFCIYRIRLKERFFG